MRRLAFILLAIGWLCVPASALAAVGGTVTREGTTLVYTGTNADSQFGVNSGGGQVHFTETSLTVDTSASGCTGSGTHDVSCDQTGVTAVRVLLGAGDDAGTIQLADPGISRYMDGGPGADALAGGPEDDHLYAGPDGRDTQTFAHTGDVLVGNGGADVLVADSPLDPDTVVGGAGDDKLFTNDGSSTVHDNLTCDTGSDDVVMDAGDTENVPADCESTDTATVRRTVTGSVPSGGSSILGSSSDDSAGCSSARCSVDDGGSVTLEAVAAAGLRFLAWTGGSSCPAPTRHLTISPVTANLVCSASFTGAGLLANGDAEQGVEDDPAVPHWTGSGHFTIHTYDGAGFPGVTEDASVHGGDSFFYGGDGDTETGEQTVSVAGDATRIDNGDEKATLAADLGGFDTQEDNATVTAHFLDAGAHELGAFTIGPVTAADRNGQTALLNRSDSRRLPVGTRQIKVVITATRIDGTTNDGYADNVTLTSFFDPAPPTVTTEAPTFVTPYQAILKGTYLPHGSASVQRWIEFGKTTAYGDVTAYKSGSYTGRDISGQALLEPSTTYHYRTLAQDSHGTSQGPDQTFTTPAADVRAGCANTSHDDGQNYDWELCGIPDLDQVRKGQLPNDGFAYCAPTSATDLMAFLADGGKDVLPGAGDWTQPGNFATMSGHLATMGSYMSTVANVGTNGTGFVNGLTKWLAHDHFGNNVTSALFDASQGQSIDLETLSRGVMSDALAVVVLGTYEQRTDSGGVHQDRVGGHLVALTGLTGDDDFRGATMYISDPFTAAIDDTTQSPYRADRVHLSLMTARFPATNGYSPQTLPKLDDYAYRDGSHSTVIDGLFFVTPARVATPGPGGRVTVSSPVSLQQHGNGPVERNYRLPGHGAVSEVSLPPGGDAADVLRTGSSRIFSLDLATGRASTFARGISGAHALDIGGDGQNRFLAGRSGLASFSAGGKRLATHRLRGARSADIAFDQARNRLAVLDVQAHRLRLFTSRLKSAGSVKLSRAALRGHGAAHLDVSPAGQIAIHRDGSSVFASSGSARASAAARKRIRLHVHRLRGARRPTGLAITDEGHILVGVKGRLAEFLASGKRVKHSRYAGLPARRGRLSVAQSFNPFSGPGRLWDTPLVGIFG